MSSWEISEIIKIAGFAALTFGSLAAMEAVAWWSHKRLMHGPLWFLHASHHRPHRQGWELNDVFALVGSLASMVLIMTGLNGYPALLAVGIGFTLYGIGYFIFHDIIAHRRFGAALGERMRKRWPYLERILRAHRLHHRSTGRDDAEAFGFLWASAKYDPPRRISREGEQKPEQMNS